MPFRSVIIRLLQRSERYTKTDMVYLATTGIWSNAGTFVSVLGSFLLYVVFSHFVPKEAYGTYQYLLSLAAIVGACTLTGMNAAITRSVARGHEGAFTDAIRAQLRWGLFPLLGAWAVGIYYLLSGNLLLGAGMGVIGVLIPLSSSLNSYSAFLAGKKAFKRSFLYSLWWNVPYYVLTAGFAYLFPQLSWLSVLLLIANLGSQTVGLYIAFQRTVAAYRPNGSTDADMLKYGKHLSAMSVFSMLVAQADNVLAFHFLGATGLAIYSFATAVPDRIAGLFKFVPVAALSKLSEKEPDAIRAALGTRFWIASAGMTVVALATLGVIGLVFQVFFPAYSEAVPYAQLYCLTIATSLVSVLTNALTAARATRSLYAYSIASSVVQLALQTAGVIAYGLWGLIIARILAGVFNVLFAHLLYRRIG